MQINVAMNLGSLGGLLLYIKEECVNVNTTILSTTNSNTGIIFTIPSNEMKRGISNIPK